MKIFLLGQSSPNNEERDQRNSVYGRTSPSKLINHKKQFLSYVVITKTSQEYTSNSSEIQSNKNLFS